VNLDVNFVFVFILLCIPPSCLPSFLIYLLTFSLLFLPLCLPSLLFPFVTFFHSSILLSLFLSSSPYLLCSSHPFLVHFFPCFLHSCIRLVVSRRPSCQIEHLFPDFVLFCCLQVAIEFETSHRLRIRFEFQQIKDRVFRCVIMQGQMICILRADAGFCRCIRHLLKCPISLTTDHHVTKYGASGKM